MRVAIVAPYPALRAGLRALLTAQGLAVTVEAAEPGELLGPRAVGDFEVALVDLEGGVIGALLELAAQLPGFRVVLLGPAAEADRVAAAVGGRPWGYVPREAGGALLAGAVRAVAAGLVALDPTLASRVAAGRPLNRPADDGAPLEDLTAREREVIALVAEGLANKQIAHRLGISEHTVKFHVAAILAKLGAASRTEASRLAARRGLIAL